jgi:hypothetical protein
VRPKPEAEGGREAEGVLPAISRSREAQTLGIWRMRLIWRHEPTKCGLIFSLS